MKLQTQVPLEPSLSPFGYEDKSLLLGSCFAQNIGCKLDYYKFQSVTNPFGIIFNPISLQRLVQDAVANKTYTECDVFESNGIWKSYLAHSNLNASSRLQAVINLQEAQQQLRLQLLEASHLVLTLGTAWVYRHMATNQIVANCHKIPQKEFRKELLSVDTITQILWQMENDVRSLNPKINILFTVSPVRHLKDGFVQNTRSKAHLISAVHEVVDTTNATYFPAYEIVMDELRDYRFYTGDMLHLTTQTINYIWERFVEVYACAKAKHIMAQVASIQNRLQHKAFLPESSAHQDFQKKIQEDIAQIRTRYPLINF